VKAAHLFHTHLEALGYSTIETDYVFSDVFAATKRDCTVSLVAFTHSPPSYRNAAIAVVEVERGKRELAEDYRSLGAPILFAIDGDEVTVWKVQGEGPPSFVRREPLRAVSSLFSEYRAEWSPQRIHGAKSFALLKESYQLDFVDLGLLPAIEGVIHTKLDRLLTETLAEAVRLRVVRPGEQVNDQLVFRTVFRLLAAKVLQDREHPVAKSWDAMDIDSVLQGISLYYTLPKLPGEANSFKDTVFEAAWSRLRGGINFRNISSDDLAFVYENTLVTKETREHFGTHSTPRAVAEYIVSRLNFADYEPSKIKVYEPFAGSGVFMVAALRQLRDLLPVELTEAERHRLLVNRIVGDEIDPFATEVATLSLILADYPNENGWAVSTIDLFANFDILQSARGANIVLCNPPFEEFEGSKKLRYRGAVERSPYQPIAALSGILDARPSGLGFVLPEPFIGGERYARQRQRLEHAYKQIEVVALPDRIFKASVVRSSLLIAQDPRQPGEELTSLRATVVRQQDRERFLRTTEISEVRERQRAFSERTGQFWVPELQEVWEYLANARRLETVAETHKGVEWSGGQASAVFRAPRDHTQPGIHAANAVHTFALSRHVYLEWRKERFAKKAAAYKRPWDKPKLLANAARLSRGPWCFAASPDRTGLAASQQLFGIWPKTDISLETLAALLNSPVAVAFLAAHSPPDRIRVETVDAIPIPAKLPPSLDALVARYIAIVGEPGPLVNGEDAIEALNDIDAMVLHAYDLPPRLERQLLEYFRGDRRPTVHDWPHWFPPDFQAYMPLHRYLSEEFEIARSGWVLNVFKPLPEDEAAALREALD
jgi:hypothetical protein